jgi:hypothetical protein
LCWHRLPPPCASPARRNAQRREGSSVPGHDCAQVRGQQPTHRRQVTAQLCSPLRRGEQRLHSLRHPETLHLLPLQTPEPRPWSLHAKQLTHRVVRTLDQRTANAPPGRIWGRLKASAFSNSSAHALSSHRTSDHCTPARTHLEDELTPLHVDGLAGQSTIHHELGSRRHRIEEGPALSARHRIQAQRGSVRAACVLLKLRIVTLWFGTGRQKMVIER